MDQRGEKKQQKHSYLVQKNNCCLLKLLPASKSSLAFRDDVSLSSVCFPAKHGISSWLPQIPPGVSDTCFSDCRNTNASNYTLQLCALSSSLGPLYLQAQNCITNLFFLLHLNEDFVSHSIPKPVSSVISVHWHLQCMRSFLIQMR